MKLYCLILFMNLPFSLHCFVFKTDGSTTPELFRILATPLVTATKSFVLRAFVVSPQATVSMSYILIPSRDILLKVFDLFPQFFNHTLHIHDNFFLYLRVQIIGAYRESSEAYETQWFSDILKLKISYIFSLDL